MFLEKLPEDSELYAMITDSLLWQASKAYIDKNALAGFVSAEANEPFVGFNDGNRSYLPVVDVFFGKEPEPVYVPLFLTVSGERLISINLSHLVTLEDIKTKVLDGCGNDGTLFKLNV